MIRLISVMGLIRGSLGACLLSLSLSFSVYALTLGGQAPFVVLEGKSGGLIAGERWDSRKALKGEPCIVMYVDPDVRAINEPLEQALFEAFKSQGLCSIALINLQATWLPNWILLKALAKKQKQFPTTIYVKDNHKRMVKDWGLIDDQYNVLAFDYRGELIYQQAGKLSVQQGQELIDLLKQALKDTPNP